MIHFDRCVFLVSIWKSCKEFWYESMKKAATAATAAAETLGFTYVIIRRRSVKYNWPFLVVCVITTVCANHRACKFFFCFVRLFLPMDDLFVIGMAIYNDYHRLMLNCFSFFAPGLSVRNQFYRAVVLGPKADKAAQIVFGANFQHKNLCFLFRWLLLFN